MADNELKKARANYDTLVLRCGEKQDALRPIQERLAAIPGELVDASGKKRAELIAERAGLLGEQDILSIEVKELERRCDVAQLTIYEVQLALAQAVYQVEREKHQVTKAAFEQADQALRAHINPTTPQPVKDRIKHRELGRDLRISLATCQAQLTVDAAAMRDAGNVVQNAEAELEKIKLGLL